MRKKHIHFVADTELIDKLDGYKTRWISRSQLLEDAIKLWISQQELKQVKVISRKKQEVRDWRDML